MERHGFIHDMMDVKVLILYVMARVQYPVDEQKIYELCYQDECLSYFDVREAIPQMVDSGHLERNEDGGYVITDKGKVDGAVIEDSLAFPVAQRAKQAVKRFNREVRRDSLIRTKILPREGGDFSVVMGLHDEQGCLMNLELMAPTQQQARKLASTFHDNAEGIFKTVMTAFLNETEASAKHAEKGADALQQEKNETEDPPAEAQEKGPNHL